MGARQQEPGLLRDLIFCYGYKGSGSSLRRKQVITGGMDFSFVRLHADGKQFAAWVPQEAKLRLIGEPFSVRCESLKLLRQTS